MLSKHSSSIRIGAVTILGSLFQCPASNPLGKEPLSNVHPKLSPGFVSAVQHRGTGISCWPHCDWDKPGCPRTSWLSSQQSSHYIAGYRAKLKSTASTGKRSTMDGPPADKHNHPITFTQTPFLGVILVLDAGRPFSVLSTHPCIHTRGFQASKKLHEVLHTEFVVLIDVPNLCVGARSQDFNQAAFICPCSLGNHRDKSQDCDNHFEG